MRKLRPKCDRPFVLIWLIRYTFFFHVSITICIERDKKVIKRFRFSTLLQTKAYLISIANAGSFLMVSTCALSSCFDLTISINLVRQVFYEFLCSSELGPNVSVVSLRSVLLIVINPIFSKKPSIPFLCILRGQLTRFELSWSPSNRANRLHSSLFLDFFFFEADPPKHRAAHHRGHCHHFRCAFVLAGSISGHFRFLLLLLLLQIALSSTFN